MQGIRNTEISHTMKLIPQAQKAYVQKIYEQSKSYGELAKQRNKLISQSLKQSLAQQETVNQQAKTALINNQKQERLILVSLLVVSLISISSLLVKLKVIKK